MFFVYLKATEMNCVGKNGEGESVVGMQGRNIPF